jgi:hypothetical protein
MPVKITPLALSFGLAAEPFLIDKLHDGLVEPPHIHQESQIPGQSFTVTSAPISGANVVGHTHSVDANVMANMDLIHGADVYVATGTRYNSVVPVSLIKVMDGKVAFIDTTPRKVSPGASGHGESELSG